MTNSLKQEVEKVFFEMGKEIKIHKLVDGNLILEIDYEKYVNQILEILSQQ